MDIFSLLVRHFWVAMIAANCLNGWIFIRKGSALSRSTGIDEDGFRKLGVGYTLVFSIPYVVLGIGILSGTLQSVFSIFQPPWKNIYVVPFYLSILVIWVCVFWWIFFRDGDQFLETYFKPLQATSSRSTIFTTMSLKTQFVVFSFLSLLGILIAWNMDVPDFVLSP